MQHIARVNIPSNPREVTSGVAKMVVDGLAAIGFIAVEASVADVLARRVYMEALLPFMQMEKKKLRYRDPAAQGERGFSRLRDEQGRLCRHIGPDGQPVADAKEFFAVGRDPDELPARLQSGRYRTLLRERRWESLYRPNVWPKEPAWFEDLTRALYGEMSEVGSRVFRAVAVHLGLPTFFFDRVLAGGADMMRLLHYPGLSEEEIGQINVWGCRHQDLSIGTVLARGMFYGGDGDPDDGSGLYIKPRDVEMEDTNNWVRGIAPEDCVFVQLGNLGERLLAMFDARFRGASAWHEIRAPKRASGPGRCSAALFKHGPPHLKISGLRSGDYVTGRMEQLGFAREAE